MSSVIIEKLKKDAALFPDKTAFAEYGGDSVTYSGLLDRTLAIASALTEMLPAGDAPVAVITGRSPKSIAALLAVIAAGRWYVMIDAELPEDRINSMLETAAPAAVISDRKLVLSDGTPVLPLSGDYTDAPDFKEPERAPSEPLFGIFTSGSTGKPKLVIKSSDAMFSFIDVYCRTFGFTSSEVFGNQIPFFFDASTKDIFSTLWLGASCLMLPPSAFAFPVNLISMLNEYRVSTIVWVPSALSVAAKFNVFAAARPEYLKNVLFVGERMPVKYLNVWRDALPECRFVNLYGSTEVAGNSCYYTVTRSFEAADILPIGQPFEGTKLYIIDPATGLEASEGEICVTGPGLANGYYGDPEKTSSVFREINIDGKLQRVYFSGDFGRIDSDGNYICISRRDSQIKHMGHRIELGEIEAAAGSVEAVHEVCCKYDAENEKILLFFSADSDISRELRRTLAGMLPKYELPHKFIYMPSLPHNRNGKLDRAAIGELVSAGSGRKPQ